MDSKLAPTPKVASGTAAGSVTVMVVWVLGLVGLAVPATVAAALTVLFGFAAAWLRPDASSPGSPIESGTPDPVPLDDDEVGPYGS